MSLPELPGDEQHALLPDRPHDGWSWRHAPALTRRDALVLLAILLATGMTYFARLGTPGEEIPLDERHYVPDARDVLSFGTESDTRVSEDSGAFVVHPPVAKWFIAAGIRLFGDDPFGWRFFGAVVATLSVAIIYLLARRLWASPWFAAAAAILLAADGLWFVQARVAMLDIYAAFFVLAGIWLVFEDRDRTAVDHRGPRWWRLAAGGAFGFALATKWSTLPYLLAAILLGVVWESLRLHRRRLTLDRQHIGAARLTWSILSLGGSFLLLPVSLYVATFVPWFIDDHRYDPPRCVSTDDDPRTLASRWLCYQHEMFDFHKGLAKYDTAQVTTTPEPDGAETVATVTKPGHPYFSHGFSWPWLGRPVSHYYEVGGEGATERRSEVLGLPNPLVWIPGFFVALPLLVWWSVRPKQGRRPDLVPEAIPEAAAAEDPWLPLPPPPLPAPAPRRFDPVAPLLLLLFVAGYGPIVLADMVDRPVFLFYATPMLPFLVLATVHVLVRLTDGGRRAAWIAVGFVGGCVLVFAYFYPLLAAWPLSPDGFFGWGARIWYSTQPFVHYGDFRFPPVDCLVENKIKIFCWI